MNETFASQVGVRLREEREALQLSQAEAAHAAAVTREHWGRCERGQAVPGGEMLARFAGAGADVAFVLTSVRSLRHQPAATAGNVSLVPADSGLPRLLVDERPVRSYTVVPGDGATDLGSALFAGDDWSAAKPLVVPIIFQNQRTTREYQVVPDMVGSASAGTRGKGTGDEAIEVDVAGVIAMDREFLRDQFGHDGPGFLTVKVAGNSMYPTLADGDRIMVDTRINRVGDSAIYVVQSGVDLLVKRVQRKLDGSLVLMSDNPTYPPESLSTGEATLLRVIGRMVWPRVR